MELTNSSHDKAVAADNNDTHDVKWGPVEDAKLALQHSHCVNGVKDSSEHNHIEPGKTGEQDTVLGVRRQELESTKRPQTKEQSYSLSEHYEDSYKNAKQPGHYECETIPSYEEADLHKQLLYCTKNPGHMDFIPVNQFNLEHVPLPYRCEDIFNFLRVLINLTVRICTTFTSNDRCKIDPGSNTQYPYCNSAGKTFLRTATGMVGQVVESRDEEGEETKTCPCEACKSSSTPATHWYKVKVYTSKHVVFDSTEAKHSTCQLFYDSEEEKNKIQELKGDSAMGDSVNDWSWMICFIHDIELGERLKKMLERFESLSIKLFNRFRESGIEYPYAFIVSHPHGCSKHVTVGEWTYKERIEEDFTRYTYTTQTCPGSSGAPVFIPGRPITLYFIQPHSRRCVEEGFNMSGIWFY